MNHRYDAITIIFNPNSTGDAAAIAQTLSEELATENIAESITLTPTEYAGHAEKIAREAAASTQCPLVVSVSGDGGYHEVINGVLTSGNKQAVCTVEGAGNANDHWRIVHNAVPLSQRVHSAPAPISILKLTLQTNDSAHERYAHSYIGIGVSAKVAHELNQEELNVFNEKRILIRELFAYRAFRAIIYGRERKLDSIVCANINEMAKQLKLDAQLRLDSAKFKVIVNGHHGPWRLIRRMIGSTITPDTDGQVVTEFECGITTRAWIQCDGEPEHVAAGTHVRIAGLQDGLLTV